jgi:ribosomal-protein-alanine N-acetyltransferase
MNQNTRFGDCHLMLPITSERLILRRFTDADIPDLLAFVSHPSVANEVEEMGTTEYEIKKYIKMQNSFQPFEKHKVFELGIERKEDKKLIGLVTMIIKHHSKGELGFGLGIDYRGQGYATEAAKALIDYGFSELKLHRVQAIASSGNPASCLVIERLGMRLEGRLREANFRDGKWCDLLDYGILENEW